MIRERLPAGDYILVKQVGSAIDPLQTLYVEIGIRCPRCKQVLPPLKHGKSQVCRCGLIMTLFGGALECEIEG